MLNNVKDNITPEIVGGKYSPKQLHITDGCSCGIRTAHISAICSVAQFGLRVDFRVLGYEACSFGLFGAHIGPLSVRVLHWLCPPPPYRHCLWKMFDDLLPLYECTYFEYAFQIPLAPPKHEGSRRLSGGVSCSNSANDGSREHLNTNH